MKRILKWIITICMILPMVRIVNAGPHVVSFTLTDGRTVTVDDYKDDVVMVVWYSAETDANGDAVNANSASMLKSLSEDPLMDTEGLTVIAVALEDMDPEKINAFVDKYGRHNKILYAYNGQSLYDLHWPEEDGPFKLTICEVYVEGKMRTAFDNNRSANSYSRHLSEYLFPDYFSEFILHERITYHQTEARKMLEMINEFRTGEDAWYWNEDNTEKIYATDLNTVVYDYELERVAMLRASEISLFFAHSTPTGKSNPETLRDKGLPADAYYGENLAFGRKLNTNAAFTLLQETNKKYKDQGHRRNMLHSSHTAVGIACCEANGYAFWVQIFSDKTINTDPITADDSEHVTTIRASDKYLFNWSMEKNTLELEPGQTGLVSGYNRLVIRTNWGIPKPLENVLSWESSDTNIISVTGESFVSNKEGTAVLSAIAPDQKTTVKFTVNVQTKPKPTPTPTPTPAAKEITMHRLYNPNSWEHFYTGNAKEKDALVKMGWQYEGVGWTAPEKSEIPVYRLYNPNNGGDHHYTMNKKEYDALVKAGWTGEGIRWYSDDGSDPVPVWREYNPGAPIRNHNYTANKKEHDYLVTHGWKDEGIGWWGINK